MLFKVLLAGMCSLCLVGTATLASAHEFIVKPDKTQAAKGESVGVQAQAAHVFMISEEAEPVETVVVELIQGNAKEPVKLAEDAKVKALVGKAALPADGPAMIVGHRLPQIWSDTTEGVLEGGRKDLEAKGKKVLMGMIPRSSEELLLCVDSDFDYLFAGRTPQSKEVAEAKFMFHTYAYATENYLCYAPSLHNVCVKATKNDTRIFDFVKFMHEYSCTIYPLFLWYAYSAQLATENVFPLIDFKQSVRIGYLDIEDNGSKTIEWLRRNVSKRENLLRQRNPRMIEPMKEFEVQLRGRGLTPENAYLFMHGHTLMDNVVLIMLNTVCEKLRAMSIAKITASKKQGVALKNEMSNYTNSLRSIRDVLLDNENYTKSPLYKRLERDIERYIARTIWNMKRNGEIRDTSMIGIIHKLRTGQQ